jgi:hypothetical protein
MELTVYNPQKGRLETINVEFTEENTTWFENAKSARDIATITDFDGGLLIKKRDYSYPHWIYDMSRDDVGYNQKITKELMGEFE